MLINQIFIGFIAKYRIYAMTFGKYVSIYILNTSSETSPKSPLNRSPEE